MPKYMQDNRVVIGRTKADKDIWAKSRDLAKQLAALYGEENYYEALGRMIDKGLNIVNKYTQRKIEKMEELGVKKEAQEQD